MEDRERLEQMARCLHGLVDNYFSGDVRSVAYYLAEANDLLSDYSLPSVRRDLG